MSVQASWARCSPLVRLPIGHRDAVPMLKTNDQEVYLQRRHRAATAYAAEFGRLMELKDASRYAHKLSLRRLRHSRPRSGDDSAG
jgi:hypothetical protein